MRDGLYTVVCTCVHRVHSAGQIFGDTDGETDGLCCRCGGPGLPRAQEGQSTRLKTGNCVGSGGAGANKGSYLLQHFIFYWTWQMFVAGLSVGSAPVLFLGRGRHGRIRHQPDLTWVCWWRQGTEEEVLLCRAATAGHNFFFFGAVGDGNIEVKVLEAGTVLLILGAMLGGGTFCSDTRRTPFPLIVTDGLQWKGERGPG